MKSAVTRKALYTVKDLVGLVAAESRTTAELKEVAMGDLGMSKTVFYELIQELHDVPGVTFEPKRKKWTYANPEATTKLT